MSFDNKNMKKYIILWINFFFMFSVTSLLSVGLTVVAESDPRFYSFEYSTYDTDNDGVDDAVKVNFDPDFPVGYSGTVIVNVGLYTDIGTFRTNVSGAYFLSENDYDNLELDLGTVNTAGIYYLIGEIFFESIKTYSITTSTFRLGVLPYFYSFDSITYDLDGDGIDDGVRAEFDPDVPGGYSIKATVHAILYSFDNILISNASDEYSLTGIEYDYFELDLGTVSTAGLYYLLGEIVYESMITDSSATPTFRLGLEPYFYSFNYQTYDSDYDGLDDGAKAVFDPDVPSGYTGEVIIFVDLYSSNRTLINTAHDTYSISGGASDYFVLDLGSVTTSGYYYLLGEIMIGSISTDIETTSTFYLNFASTTIDDKSSPVNGSILPYKPKTGHKRGQPLDSTPSAGGTPGFESFSVLTGIISLIAVIWHLQRKKSH